MDGHEPKDGCDPVRVEKKLIRQLELLIEQLAEIL